MISTHSATATSACSRQVSDLPLATEPAPPWPPSSYTNHNHRHHHSCSQQKIFSIGILPLAPPFELFSSTGKLPLASLTTQAASPCRDFHFATSHDHHHGRNCCQWCCHTWLASALALGFILGLLACKGRVHNWVPQLLDSFGKARVMIYTQYSIRQVLLLNTPMINDIHKKAIQLS